MVEQGEKSPYCPIEDYAIIGDCHCAALISRHGSIDWLCLPRFDSPSVFSALIDAEKGGRFAIHPVENYSVERRYVEDTNVLETTFQTESGRIKVTDLMPIYSYEDRQHRIYPERQILRVAECLDGGMQIRVIYEPRLLYGQIVPRMVDRRALGIFCEHRGTVLVLRSEVALELSAQQSTAHGTFTLRKGETRCFSLAFSHGEPAIIPFLEDEARLQIPKTIKWWKGWISHCSYKGLYRDAVIRSALTLKLMVYAPSGAVIAAPTTSLPEEIGGVRNWDYRYCWLRDASMTLNAFYRLGYGKEGEAFLSWLLHTTRLTRPELQILYDVYGRIDFRERELNHLDGYASSRPVRIGNDAEKQLQMDIYGEVIQAVFEFVKREHKLDRPTSSLLVSFGKTVCRKWREPDEGIWEIRSGRYHHTYSKVMCWVALDRLLKLHERHQVRLPERWFMAERDAIRADIEEHGYNDKIQSYVSTYGSEELDVSLLLLPLYGYLEATEERMRSTYARVRESLAKDGLFYRYRPGLDGLPPGEGSFAVGSFWATICRARQGEIDAARTDFEHILSYANDVGLFGEEIDPDTGAALGNFPQAYTHVGLINAALTLDELSRSRATGGISHALPPHQNDRGIGE